MTPSSLCAPSPSSAQLRLRLIRISSLALLAAIGLAGSRAEAACNPDPPSNGDAVVCDGNDSTGFDASGATNITITTDGDTTLDDSGALDSAILLSDDSEVTLGTIDAVPPVVVVNITEAGGAGVRGNDDNTVTNHGTINIDAANGVGIDLVNDNFVALGTESVINLNADDSVGVRVGDDSAITNDGAIDLDGANGVGLEVGDDNQVSLGTDSVITVTGNGGAGVRGGDRNTITNDGMILVDGADSVGIEVGDGFDDPAGSDFNPVVTNTGDITVTGANGVGIRANDNHDVTNEGTITIDASATGGIALEGRDDNPITNDGTIIVDAANGRAIKIRDNTGLDNPNGAIVESNSQITINGDGGIAVEVGDNVGAITDGIVDLNGDNTIGLSVGNKTVEDAAANHTNLGTLNVTGDDSFGMKVGDGWTDGADVDDDRDPNTPPVFDPRQLAGLRNGDTINVTGDDSVGMYAGDDANVAGNHNSFIRNAGPIDVTGTDAIGVSLGGNDFLVRADPDNPAATDGVFSFNNAGGTITGDEDAGPLVVFRSFVGTNENRVINPSGAGILADLTNQGIADRAIAIRGTDGVEFVFNAGDITGDIELLGGDDRFAVNAGSTFDGTLFGGAGDDELLLGFTDQATPETFDLSLLEDFERVSINGLSSAGGQSIGWAIANGNTFGGTTEVVDGGRLAVLDDGGGFTLPAALGGNFEVAPDGSVQLFVDGISTPLTVAGTADFDGELLLEYSDQLNAPGSYRLIDVALGYGTTAFATETFDATRGLFSFETIYDAMGLRLDVTEAANFAAVANSGNLRSIAAHLDAIDLDGTGATDLQDEITALSGNTGDLNDIFEVFSPEAYDAQTTLIVDSHRRIANLLLERPRDCTPVELDPWQASRRPVDCHARKFSLWVAGFGSFRDRDGFTGHPEYSSQIGGAMLGIDAPAIGDLELTFAVSSQQGKITVDGRGESEIVLADLTAQASWARAGFRAQSVLTYGFGSHDSRRNIRFQANDTTTPISLRGGDDHTSQHVSVAGEAGYLLEVGAIDLEPLVGFNYARVNQGGIRESDSGSFGLRVDSREDDILSVSGGLRLSTVYQHEKYLGQWFLWMDGVWRGTVDLRWRQTVLGYERELDARLLGSPDTVAGFSVDGKEDQGGFEIGAGLSFVPKVANRLELQLQYDAYRASHTVAHDLVAKVRFGF